MTEEQQDRSEHNRAAIDRDYELWLQSRRSVKAPGHLASDILSAFSSAEENDGEKWRGLKVAVLIGAALAGLSRIAAVFIWILIP